LALYLHPSINTKISSAAIPRTMKTIKTWRKPKYLTPNMPLTITAVNGKLKTMIEIPIKAKKAELR